MEVISLANKLAQPHILTNEVGIAITRTYTDLNFLSHDDLLVEGCCIILIEEGRTSMTISSEACTVEAGELLYINNGQNISDIMISADLQFRAFFLSLELAGTLASRINLNWKIRSGMMLSKYHKATLTQSEISTICLYYDMLDSKRTPTIHQHNEIVALCSAFCYCTLDIMTSHSPSTNTQTTTDYSITEQHFNRFMNLLLNDDTIHHKVSIYAEKLCITPKYLNIICQKAVHQTPSELIEKEITLRATKLLHDNTLSIKQISQQLGFNNQSHFGSFIRRITGTSPQHIRKKL